MGLIDIETLPYRLCVGLMIENAQGDVFVGQRLDSYMDAWQMPQGGIDKGETPIEAALRELTEETGLTADMVEVLGETEEWFPYELPRDLVPKLWNGKYRGQKQKWFRLQFVGQDADVNIDTKHPEFRAWKWLPKGEVLDAIVPFKREVYTGVLSAFDEKV